MVGGCDVKSGQWWDVGWKWQGQEDEDVMRSIRNREGVVVDTEKRKGRHWGRLGCGVEGSTGLLRKAADRERIVR